MTIRIELNPEIETQLAAGAQARGVALEKYAESPLRDAIASHSGPEGRLSVEGLPHVPQKAMSAPPHPTASGVS